MSTFSIVPIAGREVIQKNFVTLPSKADNYSNRRISLNERFSVVERGYSLQPQDTVKNAHSVQLMYAVPSDADLSKVTQEAHEKFLEKKARKEKQSASQECSTAETTPTRSPVVPKEVGDDDEVEYSCPADSPASSYLSDSS